MSAHAAPTLPVGVGSYAPPTSRDTTRSLSTGIEEDIRLFARNFDRRFRSGNSNTGPDNDALAISSTTERDHGGEWSDRLAETFPNLDFATFPDAGHFPHREQPDRASAEIGTFFERLS